MAVVVLQLGVLKPCAVLSGQSLEGGLVSRGVGQRQQDTARWVRRTSSAIHGGFRHLRRRAGFWDLPRDMHKHTHGFLVIWDFTLNLPTEFLEVETGWNALARMSRCFRGRNQSALTYFCAGFGQHWLRMEVFYPVLSPGHFVGQMEWM